MSNEKVMSVPLSPEVRAWLGNRADAQGRADGREAQAIITREYVRAKRRDVETVRGKGAK